MSRVTWDVQKAKIHPKAGGTPPSWARGHRGAALGFCMLCVHGFPGNGTIPAINNGLMRSFIWALNVYYIHAFVPHFAQFL